ncbi:hypothetical protein D3C76_1542180 [compost metagenome]
MKQVGEPQYVRPHAMYGMPPLPNDAQQFVMDILFHLPQHLWINRIELGIGIRDRAFDFDVRGHENPPFLTVHL